jgi:Fe-S cluster assembly ATP-binding protein
MLDIKDLHVQIEDKKIVKGVSLEILPGEVHAIMGPNGSGKSTLAYALMGHPRYEVTEGSVVLDESEIHELEPHERAQKGLFLSFQYPMEVPGVSVLNFLRTAEKALQRTQGHKDTRTQDEKISHPGLERKLPSYIQYKERLATTMEAIGFEEDMVDRSLNEGFSGGEKKKMEMVQAQMLDPIYIILDEVDSGLDVDALRHVAETATELQKNGKGIVVITHYARLLHHLKPDKVHVMVDGRIVKTGGPELAQEIEDSGYKNIV